jgi:hypothetical protein
MFSDSDQIRISGNQCEQEEIIRLANSAQIPATAAERSHNIAEQQGDPIAK